MREARYAAADVGEAWKDTPGALDWLEKHAG